MKIKILDLGHRIAAHLFANIKKSDLRGRTSVAGALKSRTEVEETSTSVGDALLSAQEVELSSTSPREAHPPARAVAVYSTSRASSVLLWVRGYRWQFFSFSSLDAAFSRCSRVSDA